MEFARYKVMGRRQYRGHQPGEVFEGRFDAAIERAIHRGNIVVLEAFDPDLEEGSFTLPEDWPPSANATAHQEAPQGASLIGKEGS